MKTNVLSGALGSLLVIAVSAPNAAVPIGADRHETEAAATAARQPATEEVVVYGNRLFLGSPEELLRAELREQMRALNERLEAELEAALEELIVPRLEVAGAEVSPVVDLPPA